MITAGWLMTLVTLRLAYLREDNRLRASDLVIGWLVVISLTTLTIGVVLSWLK